MKKIMIITSLILIFSVNIQAGNFSEIGLKIGYNSSKFIGKDIPGKGVSNLPGFALGAFVSYNFNNKFSIQPELLFTTKGSRINTIGDINLYNFFIYLEMPILAKMRFLSGGKIQPNIFCGPGLSIKTIAINDVGVLEDINGFDCGFIVGAGIEYQRLSIDLRYEIGMVNFDKSADDIDLKNQTVSFLIGFTFNRSGGR